MIRASYELVNMERTAYFRGESTKAGMMARLKKTPRAIKEIIEGLSYRKPEKERAKDTYAKGETKKRSKLKEEDVKMILFFKGMFSVKELVKMVDKRAKREAVRNILNGDSWKHLQKRGK